MTPLSVTWRLALTLYLLAHPSHIHACNLPSELSRIVAKVPAADTLLLDDGSEVVLIGAMPPVSLDSHAPNEAAWLPAETTRKHLEALVGGKAIDLAFSGRRLDRYGRQLAHVFLNQPVILNQTQTREWVQGNLIAHGLARTYALPGSAACMDDLLTHENHARAIQAGHWGNGIFQDRNAHDPRELALYRDTFQSIEGRIDRTAKFHGQQVFDFSPAGRTGFSLWIALRAGTRRTTQLISAHDLVGKRVRVRGWIEQRRGPRLTLDNLNQIEVLAEPHQAEPHQTEQPQTEQPQTEQPQAGAPDPEQSPTDAILAPIPATHQ